MVSPTHDPTTRPPKADAPPDAAAIMLAALRGHRGQGFGPATTEEAETIGRYVTFAASAHRCRVTKAYVGVDWNELAELGLLRMAKIDATCLAELKALERAFIAALAETVGAA